MSDGGGYTRIADRLLPDHTEGHAAGFIRDAQVEKNPLLECILEDTEVKFTARVKGIQLKMLPNAYIVVPPVIYFQLHDLADEEGWVFRVRHSKWNVRPRVSLTNGRNFYFSFKLAHREPLYRDLNDVIRDLEAAEWPIRTASVVTKEVAPRSEGPSRKEQPRVLDELETLQLFNKQRYEALREYIHRPIVPLPDNVLQFVTRLKRKEPDPREMEDLLQSWGPF